MAEEKGSGGNWALLLLLVFGGFWLYSRASAAQNLFPGSGACAGCITPPPGGTGTSTAPASSQPGYTGAAGAIACSYGQVFPMQLSPAGAAFMKGNEGLLLTARADASGYEIGYGHFIQPSDGLGPGSTISQAQADALFEADSALVVDCINAAVKVPLTQNQFDALADFTYNVGCAAFQRSTLLADLNRCAYAAAQEQFGQWIYVQGQQNIGLANRRQQEAALFGQANSPAQTITAVAQTAPATAPATTTAAAG